MNELTFDFIWLAFALLLFILEFVIPGAVLGFLGLAAVIVSLLSYLTIIEGWVTALTIWFILSLSLIILLRTVFLKFIEGDSVRQETDENKLIEGSIVDVTEDIYPEKNGRIHFSGSTWIAQTNDKAILVGESAVIVERQGNLFIVKALK
jgi:hypothetical protein